MRKYHQRTLALSIAAASCVLALLLVFVQYRDTRNNLNTITPGAFNYLLQTARGFDQFELAIVRYQNRQWNPANAEKLQKQYRKMFDILWSTFEVYELGYPADPPEDHIAEVREFLVSNDELISKQQDISFDEIEDLINATAPLSSRTREIGYQYFALASEERDNSICLLYTSPSPRDQRGSRMPSSA